MTEIPVSAVTAYLADAGWSPTGQTWNGGAIWSQGTEQVLVPPRDGMGDSSPRLRELLLALANIEDRPASDIARDIAHPLLDRASYRSPAAAGLDGFVDLPSGVDALQGIHDVLRVAATMLDAPRFRAGTERAVLELLAGIQLSTTTSRQLSLTLLVPADDDLRLLRSVYVATIAVAQAVQADAFEDTGVPPAFYTALSSLAGAGLQQPFELEFHWARGKPAGLPNATIDFPPDAGRRIREGSHRIGRQTALPPLEGAVAGHAGRTTMTGRVESLHDNESSTDRWRIKVRGQVQSENQVSSRRSIWARLSSQDQYDIAWTAHRLHQQVRITGQWAPTGRNARLIADIDGLITEP